MSWSTLDGTTGGGGGGSAAFSGALIKNTSLAGSPGFNKIVFATEEYDTDGYADLGTNNDRITVPAGVTKGQVVLNTDVTGDSALFRATYIRHYNSSDVLQQEFGATHENGYDDVGINVFTTVIEVSEGDYFQAWHETSDSSFTFDYVQLGFEYKDGTL